MRYINASEYPIQIRGLLADYKRLPADIINKVNDGVTGLANNAAGGRVRFATDSPVVEIKVTLHGGGMMGHMTLAGMSGTDCYRNGKFIGVTYGSDAGAVEYTGRFNNVAGMNQFEFNLPLYNSVKDVVIGVEDSARIEPPREYRYVKPVVYYGSSITQGGCASRPGNCYTSLVSRWLDADHINLGFSGSARGEQIMADYIASLSMSAFVLDYDHNAPTVEHLKATHKPFFDTVRAAQPELPIVIVTKPDFDNGVEQNTLRRAVVMETYLKALEAGDKNVYFCDGKAMFDDLDRDACTVDNCHPNDLGFYRMAKAVRREIRL